MNEMLPDSRNGPARPHPRATVERQCQPIVMWSHEAFASQHIHAATPHRPKQGTLAEYRRRVDRLGKVLRDPVMGELIAGLVSRIRALEELVGVRGRPRLSPREQELMQEMADAGWTEPPADEDIAAILEGGYVFSDEQVRRMVEEEY